MIRKPQYFFRDPEIVPTYLIKDFFKPIYIHMLNTFIFVLIHAFNQYIVSVLSKAQ